MFFNHALAESYDTPQNKNKPPMKNEKMK